MVEGQEVIDLVRPEEEHYDIKMKKKSNAGRTSFARFDFNPKSKISNCKQQQMRGIPCIVRISGRKPPSYPGAEPSKQNQPGLYNTWVRKAKVFVKFYSLFFFAVEW